MNVAVVGATGVVGETILTVLQERKVPVNRLGAFASRDRSAAVRFRDEALDVHATSLDALRDFDVVLFASGEDQSEAFGRALAQNSQIVIDNSSAFRMDADVPLIVPEVNAAAVRPEHRIFPVANCTAIVLVMALNPIKKAAGLRNVNVATYQAVSGAGRAGLEELAEGENAWKDDRPARPPAAFVAPIFRNVVPQIGSLDPLGDTGEEKKVVAETRKILELPKVRIAAMTVRVPVRYAHSEAVFVKTDEETSVDELARAFEKAPGLVYHREGIVTPLEVEGQDLVHVARLRSVEGSRRHFQLWVVGDQVRKGAATNAVQILQLLHDRGMVGVRV